MAAPKGNEYWKRVKNWKCGADRAYTPDQLWEVALRYFKYIEDSPLQEQKAFGTGLLLTVTKMRAMTITGFCVFAEISKITFDRYDKQEAYCGITTRIRDIIYTQKFEGACADLLNANIIARELGLADKHDITANVDSIAASPLNDLPLDKLIAANKALNGK